MLIYLLVREKITFRPCQRKLCEHVYLYKREELLEHVDDEVELVLVVGKLNQDRMADQVITNILKN